MYLEPQPQTEREGDRVREKHELSYLGDTVWVDFFLAQTHTCKCFALALDLLIFVHVPNWGADAK